MAKPAITYKKVEVEGKWFVEETKTTVKVKTKLIPLAEFEENNAEAIAKLEAIVN